MVIGYILLGLPYLAFLIVALIIYFIHFYAKERIQKKKQDKVEATQARSQHHAEKEETS